MHILYALLTKCLAALHFMRLTFFWFKHGLLQFVTLGTGIFARRWLCQKPCLVGPTTITDPVLSWCVQIGVENAGGGSTSFCLDSIVLSNGAASS